MDIASPGRRVRLTITCANFVRVISRSCRKPGKAEGIGGDAGYNGRKE
jgi:hypothetical protein